MIDADKKQFWLMINVAMELTNHPPLTKEAIVTWWHLLSKYDYEVVEKAIDGWCKTMSKSPMPNDILNLCKPNVTIYARLPSPLAHESNERHAAEVVAYVAKNIKPERDYRDWIKPILANPKNYPDISFRSATEALAAKTH
jgi:hypothetical protein